MADSADSDSEVEFPGSRKRKLNLNTLEVEDDDSEDDDEDSEGDDDKDDSDEDESGDNDDDAVDDVDLDEDVDGDQCSICLMEFTDQLLGVPDSCSHIFCSVCILEWSKNINTCPVDRKVFHAIAIYPTKDGPVIEQITVEDRTAIKEEYEDPTTCEVCGVGDREDRMLLCDGCDRGFHLECLTPPLDSVPDGEWFCSDCGPSHPTLDSIHDSQIFVSSTGDDTPSIQQESNCSTGIGQRESRSSASTATRHRARTVATTRARQRTRGQTGSRRNRTRQQNERSSSRQGDSSSVSRSKRKAKKKRKRRRRRKRKTHELKGKLEAKNERKRLRNDVSPSRYVLPDEMEPSASFSLFGSDYSLEYSPIVDAPAHVTQPRSEYQRLLTTSNPDLLGSIFTGLNTLYHKDLSLDKKGRVKISEDPEGTKSESPDDPAKKADKKEHSSSGTTIVITNTACKEIRPSSLTKVNEATKKIVPSGEKHQAKTKLSRDYGDNRDNEEKKDNPRCRAEGSTLDVNKKRLKYFETNCQKSEGGSDHTHTTSRGGLLTTTVSWGSDKEPCVSELMSKLKSDDEQRMLVFRDSRETGSKPRLSKSLKDSARTSTLSSYKIPRKKPTSASGVSGQTRQEDSRDTESVSRSKRNASASKAKRTVTFQNVGYSQPRNGILHLLPKITHRKGPLAEKRINNDKYISNVQSTALDLTSPLKSRNYNETNSYTCSATQNSTTCGGQVEKTKSVVSSDRRNSVSSVNVRQLQKTSSTSTKFGDGDNSEKNRTSKSHFVNHSSTEFTKITPKNSSTTASFEKQTVTNLSIIETINQRKSALTDDEFDKTDKACSRTTVEIEKPEFDSQFHRPELVSCETVTSISQTGILPVLTSVSSCPRPVAVVHPTKQGTPEASGQLSGIDATKRREEGIERLRRTQKISDEVKEALKPFYRHKEITKEHYKLIYKRAVEKIRESTAPVESRGVSILVRNYVKKIKGNQLNLNVGK